MKYVLKILKIIYLFLDDLIFYLKIRKYKNSKKIIYTITPPPSLRNIGDHAQVLAIKKWFEDNFKEYLVLEFDKNEIYKYINSIKKIVNKDDLIFLHSGGNLGDRGLWSENARRLVIKNFPKNKIISLPQTIFFSDTKKGREELEITKSIYNSHSNLTIIARDEYSYKLARKYFPKCKTLVCPDFVLYLAPSNVDANFFERRENILLCFRNDSESVINEDIKNTIKEYIKKINENYYEYDTTLDRDISRKNREHELELVLSLFRRHKLVITDRLHGVIFSVITKTPCIAMKTVDHKLTESVKWFADLNYIAYTEDHKQLPELIDRMLKIKNFNSVDWRALYFDDLKTKILSSE